MPSRLERPCGSISVREAGRERSWRSARVIAVDERPVPVHVAAKVLVDRGPDLEKSAVALMQVPIGLDRFLDPHDAIEWLGGRGVDARSDAGENGVADRSSL